MFQRQHNCGERHFVVWYRHDLEPVVEHVLLVRKRNVVAGSGKDARRQQEVIIDYADRENPRTFSGEEKMPYELASFARK